MMTRNQTRSAEKGNVMYQKTRLSNGLRVVTKDMRERDSVAVGLWIGGGGRHEEDRVKGVAHFLEHIAFKGSAKYSCDEIKELIEGVGGALNAFTSEEQTCYYAKIPAQHISRTFDILADMVFFPDMARKDVVKERSVIVEEIKMYHDLPQYYVLDLLDGLVWPDHPLGKNLAGTPETVSAMTSEDLRQFHRRHYTMGNAVIAVCGKVRHKDFVALAERKVKKLAVSDGVAVIPANNAQEAPRVNFNRRETEQMHLALGMLGLENDHPDRYALNLLNIILGGNMSSRLFDEVREKRGLAYSISSSLKYLKDTGMFMIRAGVDNKKLVEAVDVILKELKKIRHSGVTEDEFKRSRDYYLGQILLGLEDTLDHMLWIGESVLMRDRIRTLDEIIKLVKKVKREDIRRVANGILRENRFNLAVVGPMDKSQDTALKDLMGIS